MLLPRLAYLYAQVRALHRRVETVRERVPALLCEHFECAADEHRTTLAGLEPAIFSCDPTSVKATGSRLMLYPLGHKVFCGMVNVETHQRSGAVVTVSGS